MNKRNDMILHDADKRQVDFNGLVEAFKAAHAAQQEVDLMDFLPAPNHPLYRPARRELLRVDLALSWLEGRPKRLEDYTRQFPDLLQDRMAIQEIAFEEYRQRTLAGESPVPAEYEKQYGITTADWAATQMVTPKRKLTQEQPTEVTCPLSPAPRASHGDMAQALLRQNAQQSNAEPALLLANAMTALPEIGTTFLSFQLIAELGRGSFGRVYLARQGDLANRLVALKITVDLRGEEQKLAQLQHTNVVPIYSVHQVGPFQAVCMPYFGSTTLVDLIKDVRKQSSPPKSGTDLVRSLRTRKTELLAKIRTSENAVSDQGKDGVGSDGSATLKMLEDATYVEAVLWIAERLTEGLIHAHERGILHRDLKPANILLTDDGQPMLLDFNLSADTKLRAGLGELQVGGTLPYMAPEHMEAMRGGDRTHDARSDLYALGVVLFELLTGRLPFELRPGPLVETVPIMISDRTQAPPFLRRWNPAVSPAVESMVRHCLHSECNDRYQSAQELHEDLKRHRQHRPLRHAPEPSIRERSQKWVRRHPRLTSPVSVAATVLLLLALAAAPFAAKAWEQWQIDQTDRDNAVAVAKKASEESQLSKQDVESAKQKNLLGAKALDRFRDFQRQSPSSRPIMEIVNVMQMLPEAWPYEEKRLAEATAGCRRSLSLYRVLEDPQWQTQSAVRELHRAERDKLLGKVTELLYALAFAEQVRVDQLIDQSRQYAAVKDSLTLPGYGPEIWNAWEAVLQARLQSALDLNARACCAREPAARHLLVQKAELTLLRGDRKEAERLWTVAQALPVQSETEESYWVASEMIGQNRFKDALPLLDEATRHLPGHRGAWHLLAYCHHNAGKLDAAEACYNTYLKLHPDGLWGYYQRGLLLLLNKNWALAESDFDRVLKETPDLAWAHAHRASAHKGRGKYPEAIRDLTTALRLAPELYELYFERAQLHALAGNADLAALDRLSLLQHEPANFMGWTYRGMARATGNPRGSLADFDKALALNPHSSITLFNKACLLADALGCPTEAVGVLDQALEKDANFADARFKRGLLLAQLGKRPKAVADAELLIQGEPTPARHYQAASIYALTSLRHREDARRAIDLLSFALRNGHGVDRYQSDPALRPLSNFQEFRRLAVGLEILGAGTPARMRP